MSPEKPLVDATFQLEKFPGKGGWTYAALPEVPQNPDNPFGWIQVRGSIDNVELKHYKLMPMGNGRLFLPVKAEIRKKIRKQEGDWVKIVLYADDSPIDVPEEITECLKQEGLRIYTAFLSLTDGQKKAFLDWIYQAKTVETKVRRIAEMIDQLQRNP